MTYIITNNTGVTIQFGTVDILDAGTYQLNTSDISDGSGLLTEAQYMSHSQSVDAGNIDVDIEGTTQSIEVARVILYQYYNQEIDLVSNIVDGDLQTIVSETKVLSEWVSAADGGLYAVDDKVYVGDAVYKNLTGTNTNTSPTTDTTNWGLVSLTDGTVEGSTLRWDGTAEEWVENTDVVWDNSNNTLKLGATTESTTTKNPTTSWTTVDAISGKTEFDISKIRWGTASISSGEAARTYDLPFTNTTLKGIVEETDATSITGNILSGYWIYLKDDAYVKAIRLKFRIDSGNLQVLEQDARYRVSTGVDAGDQNGAYFEGTGWSNGGYEIELIDVSHQTVSTEVHERISGDLTVLGGYRDSTGSFGLVGQRLERTIDGTRWADVVSLPTFTQNSIPFAEADGVLTEENANLFWDATNDRLNASNVQIPDDGLIGRYKAGHSNLGTETFDFGSQISTALTGMRVNSEWDGSYNDEWISFHSHNGGVGTGERMRIDKDGKVGIGTTSLPKEFNVGTDTDASAVIGRAYLGYLGFSDMASFSHIDQTTTTQYALTQNSSGRTYLNCNSAEAIELRHGGTVKGYIMSGGLKMASGATINEFSTDGTLAGNSDTAMPTEKAVKTYVDGKVSAPLQATYRPNNDGGHTAWNANTNYTYNITVTGAVIGDAVVAQADFPIYNRVFVTNDSWITLTATCVAANQARVTVRVGSYTTIASGDTIRATVIPV